MIKYTIYKQLNGNNLICKKVKANNERTSLININDVQSVINWFVNTDYKVKFEGGNIYLDNGTISFELLQYSEIIDNYYLHKLKQAILAKVSPSRIGNRKKKNNIKSSILAYFNQISSKQIASLVKTVVAPLSMAALSLLVFKSSGNFNNTNAETIELPKIEPLYNNENVFITNSLVSYDQDVITDYFTFDNAFEDNIRNVEQDIVEEIDEEAEPEISYMEKSLTVREREYLSKEMLAKLLMMMCDGTIPEIKFASPNEALDYLYENADRTYYEKMLVIMARDETSYDELDDICAGVRAEGGEYYDECYRVASVGYNRYRSIRFTNYFGYGLYTQFLAPSQFSVFYGKELYLKYKGCIDSVGYQAAIDMFYSRKISTDYLSFLGSWKDAPDGWESFMKKGNQFGNHQPDSDIYSLEYEQIIEDELTMDREYINANEAVLQRKLYKNLMSV